MPVEIKKQTKSSGDFVGATGTSIFSGYYSEEYLTEWERVNDPLLTFDKMRRSDAQVRMILNAIKNPIKSSKWEIDAESGTPEEEKIAEFLDWNWFHNPFVNFNLWISEALTYLDFGFSIHEKRFKVFEHPEFGLVNILGGLGFRKQETIEQWIIDNNGLQGVRQLAYGDTVKDGNTQDVFIPADNLIINVNEREGDNYEGISLLRNIYGAWFRKQLYLKLNAIGMEKASIGIPLGIYPKGTESATDKAGFIEMLGNFALNETTFITAPEGYQVEIVKMDFDSDKIVQSIQYEDTQMSKSILFQFLEMGTRGGSGSFALGADQSDIALAAIQFIADGLCNQMNACNRLLVKWNFGENVKDIPVMKCSGINAKSGKELADVIKQLTDGGVIRRDDKLEGHVRNQYNLPQASPDEEEEVLAPGVNPNPKTDDKPEEESAQAKPELKEPKCCGQHFQEGDDLPTPKEKEEFSRDLTRFEKPLNLKKIRREFDNEEKKLTRMVKSQLAVAVEKSLRAVEILLKRNKTNRAKAARDFQPQTSFLEKHLKGQFGSIVAVGTKQAKDDLRRKGGTEFSFEDDIEFLPKHVKDGLKVQAAQQAKTYKDDIEKIVVFGITSGVESKASDDKIISNIEDSLDEYVESSKIGAGARTMVTQNINRGRDGFFFDEKNLPGIAAFQFSAVIDSVTTPICLSLDGKIVKPNDPDLQSLRPPLHHGCRSILVPITLKEPTPEITGIEIDPSNKTLVDEFERRGKPVPDMAKIKKSRNL